MSFPSYKNEKVDFFFVGVGKCGTTWLYEFFKRHQLLALPAIKEPYLIDCSEEKREKLVNSLYKGNGRKADFSNVYYWDKENPRKIKDYNPEAKILITMRKPSQRIASHFSFLKRNADIHVQGKSLAQYLDDGDPEEIVRRTDYPLFVDRYVAEFGAENVLILPLEQLKNEPQSYVNRLLDFMQLPAVTLSAEDTKPVLKGSTARNATLARQAKRLALILRSLGLLQILGSLKKSQLIRKILFRPIQGNKPVDSDFGKQTKAIAAMDRDYQKLLQASEAVAL